MRERRIDTDLGELATYELGTGPTVFLWPSLYADHQSLLPLVTDLARTRRCILVDGFGHGKSSVARRRYTLRECAAAAFRVLDVLEADRVDWIGNAWGGHVGAYAAIDAPARLRSLTMIGSPMEPLPAGMRLKSRSGLLLLALGARDLVGKLVAKAMVAPSSPSAHQDYIRQCIRDAPKGGISQAVHSISLARADFRPELPRITVPTLFVAGGDDPMWSTELARDQAARIPNVRFEIVPHAGHLVPLERPRETFALVTSFLSAHASAA